MLLVPSAYTKPFVAGFIRRSLDAGVHEHSNCRTATASEPFPRSDSYEFIQLCDLPTKKAHYTSLIVRKIYDFPRIRGI